ncbi:hypothetical protein [Sphingobacterium tabacisoli]|uniref:Glycosyltransferase RgtA/B/C/D-like domain-containing protein n=1 Tax=Sphingobacterium tabacisoli TaxID=2044855 RepID=A0ABW5L1X8_9SPHI|nr:hypothetical protein [Sphingobacterium tabacisoli]
MSNYTYHYWTVRILLYLVMVLLAVLCIQFLSHLINHVAYGFENSAWARILVNFLLIVGNILLITALLCLLYVLVSVIMPENFKRPEFLERYREIASLDSLFNAPSSRGNCYLILLTTLATLFGLLFRISISAQLILSGVLLIFFYLIHWQHHANSGLPTFIYVMICLFISTIRISFLQQYELFNAGWPFLLAVLLSLLFTAGWVMLKIRRIPVGSSSREWHISLIVVTSILFFQHFHVALKTINCQYDPIHENVVYSATVYEKCAPYNNRYLLSLTYMHKGKEYGVLMPVHELAYQQVSVGNTLSIHLHPGLLGWPWYHDDIHTRYR